MHYVHYLHTSISYLFTGVIETLLTKFAIPQFDSFARRFTHHCPTCRHVKLRKQTDPTKNRFGELRYLVSKSHGSEVGNCRDQGVFPLVTIAVSAPIFAANNGEKNLWHPGYRFVILLKSFR